METHGDLGLAPADQAAVDRTLAALNVREIPSEDGAKPSEGGGTSPRDHVALQVDPAPSPRRPPPAPLGRGGWPEADDLSDPLSHHASSSAARSALPAPDNRPTCAVCLEEPAPGERWATLACTHQFHAECISRWIRTRAVRAACPVCKAALVTRLPEEEPAAEGAGARGAVLFPFFFGPPPPPGTIRVPAAEGHLHERSQLQVGVEGGEGGRAEAQA